MALPLRRFYLRPPYDDSWTHDHPHQYHHHKLYDHSLKPPNSRSRRPFGPERMPCMKPQRHASIQPIKASQLFSAAETKTTSIVQTATSCAAIDDALRGDVDSGQAGVVCVTGDRSSGRTALAFALLSSHLLFSPTAHATLIDTAGTFDVGRLYATILLHLRRHRAKAELFRQQSMVSDTLPPQQVAHEVVGSDGEEEAAVKVLDRVKYTRVFDFVGLIDAVTEMREELEARSRRQSEGEAVETKNKEVPVQGKAIENRRGLKRIRSGVTHIDDTDEEVDENDDADTMSIDAMIEETRPRGEVSTNEAQETICGTPGKCMIIVDCVSHIFGPMMKTNMIQTSALLSSFLRSLKQITVSHALSSILINGTITWNASRQITSSAAQSNQHQSRASTYLSSIFSSSSHVVPALSPILAGYVDLHLLLTKQPWSHADAVALNSAAGAPQQAFQPPGTGKKANQVGVLEVLSDRYGDRVGRWAAFAVDAEGLVVDVDGHGRKVER